MMSLWDALRMNMMISYQELVRTFLSSTALFNMQESDNLFKEFCSSNPEKAIEQYRDYMLLHENDELLPGTGFPLGRCEQVPDMRSCLSSGAMEQGSS
nr:5'-nucleotidase [Enterobacter roggenkampii]